MIFPEKFARARKCTITSRTLTEVTEYGFVTQVSKRGNGQKWAVEFTTGLLDERYARELSAFLDSLNGRYETFTMKCPLRYLSYNENYTASGSIGTNSLSLSNLTPNLTDAILAGDFISIDGHDKVYKIVKGVSSNGSGQGVIEIFPKLQTSVSSKVVSRAIFTLRMVSDNNSLALDAIKSHHTVLISAIEV
jgi:hypothetical protein